MQSSGMQSNVNHITPVSALSVESRSEFIWKCYAHVVGAILAFAAISSYLYQSGISAQIAAPMLNNWLMVMGAFILAGWGATHLAHRLESTSAQYATFAAFIFVEALIFSPMLFIAAMKNPGIIESAAGVTVLGCVGLIATAMITRKDFSFLRGMLVWGGMLAIGGIVASLLFGFELGTWFSVAMIGFASIAMMFWYILRLFMNRN